MSYALVSAGSAVVGANSGAITPAFGQSTTANNLLILWVGAAGVVTTLPAAP